MARRGGKRDGGTRRPGARRGGKKARPGGRAAAPRARRGRPNAKSSAAEPLTPERIVAVLEARGRPWLTPGNVVTRLSLDRGTLRSVRRMLRSLEGQGRVERSRGRFRARRRDGVVEGLFARCGDRAQVTDDTGTEWNVEDDGSASPGDRVIVQPLSAAGRAPAELLQVIDGPRDTWVGILRRRGTTAFVTPYRDDGEWQVRVSRSDLAGAKDGEVVALAPVERRRQRSRDAGRSGADAPSYAPPWGRVVERFGRPGEPDADFAALVWRHRLPVEFSEESLAQAEALPGALDAEEVARRVDLRERAFVTIDPATARDHDDAVYVEALRDGAFRLWVAIADVSHYVPIGSPIDREALLRGNSVYFPDRAIPMIPERLSGNVCSLRPDVDRAVVVAELEIDRAGKIGKRGFYPAVIRSRARLSYEEAAQVMECESARHPQAKELRALARAAERLHTCRRAAGSIDFELPEAQVVLDEAGLPIDVRAAVRTVAHRAIEEAMLAANRSVAEALVDARAPALHRGHAAPSPEDIEALWDLLGSFGLLDARPDGELKPRDVAQALARAEGHASERFVNAAALRCMRQARYEAESGGHFALAFSHYTHFTSPIRRYADLVVHRVLLTLLAGGEVRLTHARARRIAARISFRERLAIEADREMLNLKKAAFLARHVGESHEGTITGVARHGLYVTLDAWFVEGLVHVSTLPEYVEFDERGWALVGASSGQRYTLGDRLSIRIEAVDPIAARINFEIE